MIDLASIPPAWAAYWLFLALPSHRPPFQRLSLALLPHAGHWVYRDDPWVVECREHWISTGQRLWAVAHDDPFAAP